MAAVPTKVFALATAPNGLPLAGVPGVPHVAHEVTTKAEAEALEATGAFTTNARHPDRAAEPDAPVAAEPTELAGPEPAVNEPAPAGEE